jgi:hypothetical protein
MKIEWDDNTRQAFYRGYQKALIDVQISLKLNHSRLRGYDAQEPSREIEPLKA